MVPGAVVAVRVVVSREDGTTKGLRSLLGTSRTMVDVAVVNVLGLMWDDQMYSVIARWIEQGCINAIVLTLLAAGQAAGEDWQVG